MLSLITNYMGSRSRQCLRLATLLLSMLAVPAWAEDCSEYPNGVIDGDVVAIAPDQIQIDRHCTIRNWPASKPLSTNFSFLTQPGQTDQRWIVVFDNVVHTGQMACNSVAGHKIWFTNGSSTSIQEGCQNLLIPVEKIDKANPVGQTTATIGVPFTYTLTMPVLFDAGTGTVINYAGSLNDLHSMVVRDDLDATGADLRYVTHQAYWRSDGTPVAHTFSNNNGLLIFDDFAIVPAGEQIILEMTVVLEDSAVNVIGNQFVNTAKWEFGRLIDGEFFEPLPGEWGISAPLTIAGPDLRLTKSGPTTLNLGMPGDFVLDVSNVGSSGAWDIRFLDRLPNQLDGGMCDRVPNITSARVFAGDGVTPVAGKGPMVEGTDFTVSFDATTCEMIISTLTPTASVGGAERLIVRYQALLDDDTQDGVSLTNIAGVVQWSNDQAANTNRQTYTRSVTNGTPLVNDHEDNHTVISEITGVFFEKTVENMTSGADPAITAEPGDVLRYSLRVRTTDSALVNFRLSDDLGIRNAEPVFAPDTLNWVSSSLPVGADTSGTDPTGGTNQAGQVEIANLTLAADDEMTVHFEVTLAVPIDNATLVSNQAQLTSTTQNLASDDPNVNGLAFPDVSGDEDPTVVQIVSVPELDVDKVSSLLEGDPGVLLAGEALRYTITVRNVGTADATGVILRDQIPNNTSYIAGTTTLNGVVIADIDEFSPLTAGMLINAPADLTGGVVPADRSSGANTVATITFDVRTDPDLPDGTVISNQAFVDAPDAGITNQPSDDPTTPVVDDPTRDVVGNVALIYAEKAAELLVDNDSPGIVDPGDTLRYTITIYNNSETAANQVWLQDGIPGNTSYVAGSTTLNGDSVADVNGASPLQSGLPVSSTDLTPPLPGVDEGILSPNASATVQFDLLVNNGVPRGTVISNQATIVSEDLVPVLTDGDGDPATGPEPTLVIVGDAQQLRISKQVAVVGGGAAEAGDTLEYLVIVRNPSAVPALNVVIIDDLDTPLAGQLTLVENSATVNGGTVGLSVIGNVLTVDYSDAYGPLQPGEEIQLRFRAVIDAALPIGTRVTNLAVVNWNIDQSAQAEVSVDVGGIVGSGTLNGTVWHDQNFDDLLDQAEQSLPGWNVRLFRNDTLLASTVSDSGGVYILRGIPPNYLTTDIYRLEFSAPDAGANTAKLGLAYSADFENGLQEIDQIEVLSGGNLLNLNMPIDPNGTVYNALSRAPLSGVMLSLVDGGGLPLPSACFDDSAQQGQVTGSLGYYKFDLNFSSGACPSGGAYRIAVTVADSTLVQGYSELIPPSSSAAAPLSVPSCPLSAVDAIPATDAFCEIQSSASVPGQAVPFGSPLTAYYVHLIFADTSTPGSSQVFNNNLPVDPLLTGVVTVSKTTPMVDVQRGQLVPYTLTVGNTYEIDLTGVDVVDRIPSGFHYVPGSARLDGSELEPEQTPTELIWRNLTLTAEGSHSIELLLGVGAGVGEGEYINRAFATNSETGALMSGQGTATVRLVPDPTFDCTDVTGKVFDDENRNGTQDEFERGIANARVVSVRGLVSTTDAHGRFHITCALVPNEARGSNFVLKLDDRTLPSGYRSSTNAVQVQRATRGKALNYSFGASIHRVVGLDMADPVFQPGTTDIRPQWESRFDVLMEELEVTPAVLRLSYLAENETKRLIKSRLKAVRKRIEKEAKRLDYRLEIETQVFWRLGQSSEIAVQKNQKRERGHE